MQAVILAAGMGKRLGAMTKNKTKCMVTLHGTTLIERSLDTLVATGSIQRIILVVGYEAQGVRDLIGTSHRGVPVSYIENPDYATTNNVYSLYLARDALNEDDTLLLESDLVYEPKIVTDLLAHPSPNVAVVDQYRSWMDGTVVTVSEANTIRQFIPKRDFDAALVTSYYKTVNIYKFSRDYLMGDYLPFLEAYVKTMGSNEYYEQVLRVISTLEKQNLAAMPLNGEKWYEIDDLQDFHIAETLFAPANEQYTSYLKRHGGYWRFPELRDFCYLVNPYFPPAQMLEEMRRSFEPLLRDYPSAAEVQDHLAAKMFDCDPAAIAVGNGAAEWITAIGTEIGASRVGVPVPTFEEYLKRFLTSEVEELRHDPCLAPDLEELRCLVDHTDALVLVNPDNPSGQCMTKAGLLEILKHVEAQGKRLILDESFVDFADPDVCTSLLTQGVLEAHPRLVIVKSISKSYGVPGSRLGVVATADAELLSRLRPHRSVWNINSFGEFFLQIVGKYQTAYAKACQQIRDERMRFHGLLCCVPNLRVIPSQANYFLCGLTGGVTASELSSHLLQNHAILVKDCTGKPGLDGSQFIRIAVRNSDDNDWFVNALTQSMEALT